MKRNKRIYLAAPYTHADYDIMQQRYEIITDVATELTKIGFHVFSPITHAHPINLKLPNRGVSFTNWMDYDLNMIALWADQIFVLPLTGVEDSLGVRMEIAFSQRINRPIFYMLESEPGKFVFNPVLLPFNFVCETAVPDYQKDIENIKELCHGNSPRSND